MIKNIFLFFGLIFLTLGCTSSKEVFMSFRNMVYSGEKLFPIKNNDSDWIFRIWINNGTSVDRVITVSYDSLFNYQGKLVEFGTLDKKGIFSTTEKHFFTSKDVEPKSGFEKFKFSIDSLKISEIKNQENFDVLLDHQPFSLYIVEFKEVSEYSQFVFRTYFPNEDFSKDNIYKSLEKFIFDEFNIKFHIK